MDLPPRTQTHFIFDELSQQLHTQLHTHRYLHGSWSALYRHSAGPRPDRAVNVAYEMVILHLKTRNDDASSLKGRGLYGLVPLACGPRAGTLVSRNTAEVADDAPALRTASGSSDVRAVTGGTESATQCPKHDAAGKVVADSIAHPMLVS